MDKYQMAMLSEARGRLSAAKVIRQNVHGQTYTILLETERNTLIDLLDSIYKREAKCDTARGK